MILMNNVMTKIQLTGMDVLQPVKEKKTRIVIIQISQPYVMFAETVFENPLKHVMTGFKET